MSSDHQVLLKRLLRISPNTPLHDDDVLGTFIKLPTWLMALDDYPSPYYDLVDHLFIHTKILETLGHLNDVRKLTVGEVLEAMKLGELMRMISEHQSIRPEKLTADRSLEDDLGITGDDFDELMVYLVEELGLTFDLNTIHLYRGPEAMFARSYKTTDLRIRDLLRWMP
ncbi:hypothetical protein [Armatimonas sp.]|uniref:hypothetical protein n=1 Tax=Armatimonas sp. TaxID=1872638 RepID=UPI00286AE11C|nr:hypothetical protein [Armatimonas sp.]